MSATVIAGHAANALVVSRSVPTQLVTNNLVGFVIVTSLLTHGQKDTPGKTTRIDRMVIAGLSSVVLVLVTA